MNYLEIHPDHVFFGDLTESPYTIKNLPSGPDMMPLLIKYESTLSLFQLYHLPLGEDMSDDLILYQPLGPRMPLPRTVYIPSLVSKVMPSLIPSSVVHITLPLPSLKIKKGGYIFSAGFKSVIGVVSACSVKALKMLKTIRAKMINLKVFINKVYTIYKTHATLTNSFNTKNEFGWEKRGLDNFGQPQSSIQFSPLQNQKTLTIEGTIFNEGIDSLSTLEADLISKAPLEAEIKEFEKYANSGVIFLLVEPTERGGKDIGNFYVESFEYTQSEFIYSNKAQKTVFKIIFKEYI